jgi:hypothetical protein
VDLTRIEAWTRSMLEAEAHKRGVRRPELRSRTDLVRMILRHDYRSLRELDDARKVVASALGNMASMLPIPVGLRERLLARLPLTASDTVRPSAPSAAQAVPEVRIPRAAPVAPNLVHEAARALEPVDVTPRDPSIEPVTRSFVEEPIRTHSMARLLASQGHKERALAIYEELLAKNDGDEALFREAEDLRHGRTPAFGKGQLPSPSQVPRMELPSSTDAVSCDALEGDLLRVRWQVSDEGQARAQTLLGDRGELALRVVVIRPDSNNVVSSEITEHGPVASHGEWTTRRAPGGTRAFAAVGLRGDGRFVSIKHAPI